MTSRDTVGLRFRKHRQPDGDLQTAAQGIGRRESAPVELHHARCNRQAQAGPIGLGRPRLREAVEWLEELRQLRLGHPQAVVAHLNDSVWPHGRVDRKSTRLNSSHLVISYAVFCLKKKKN